MPNPTSPTTAKPWESPTNDQNRTAAEAAEMVSTAKDEVVAQALKAKDRAMERGQQYAESQKGRAAETATAVGSAVREAARKLDDEGQTNIASYIEAAADELDKAAGYLRDRGLKDLARDAQGLARRHPEIFLGGMFLAGLGLSRLLKASRSKNGSGHFQPSTDTSDSLGGDARWADSLPNNGLALEPVAATSGDYPSQPR